MADDRTLAYLLDLDGEEIRYPGGHVARFVVRRVEMMAARPHGIDYALTLHGPDGKRLMGFDNAHRVRHRGGRLVRPPAAYDHWHRDGADQGRPYAFSSAADLVADFFDEIERVLREIGAWHEGS